MRHLACILLLLLSARAVQAKADSAIHVLAVGNNAVPPDGPEELTPLRYADDDAAAFCSFATHFADEIILLEVPDDETQRRFPGIVRQARPPTLQELELAVDALASRIECDRKAGKQPVLIFYYSGHGWIHRERGAALAMLDGPLTNPHLYDRILARLPADYIHLIVDACHAEAVVRPRGEDLAARVAPLSGEDRLVWLEEKTLARFPHVGVVMATAADQQAHEWTVYRQGVFTHELLSGLRGAADVNVDRKVEYSEVHAFLAAANREVADPRGRLEVQVEPPALNRRVPLVDLASFRKSGRLAGSIAGLGHFCIEDEGGNRLIDFHPEDGFRFLLTLPSQLDVLLRSDRGVARFRLEESEQKNLSSLPLSPPETSPRGAIGNALRRGLFAAPYGPAYYRGFADRSDAIPVPLAGADASIAGRKRPQPSKLPALICWAGAGLLLATATVSGALALDARTEWKRTTFERRASELADRYDTCRVVFYVSAASAAAATVAGLLLYPWNEEPDEESGPAFTPSVSPGGLGVTLRFTW